MILDSGVLFSATLYFVTPFGSHVYTLQGGPEK